MIQRIQTVYLALAGIANGLVFFTSLYDRMMEDPAEWISIGFMAAAGIAALLSWICIFLYSNRSKQKRWVKIAVVIQFVALGFAAGVLFTLGGIGTYLWDEAIGVGLLVLGLIFQFLAIRGISNDQELVRSMDRIR